MRSKLRVINIYPLLTGWNPELSLKFSLLLFLLPLLLMLYYYCCHNCSNYYSNSNVGNLQPVNNPSSLPLFSPISKSPLSSLLFALLCFCSLFLFLFFLFILPTQEGGFGRGVGRTLSRSFYLSLISHIFLLLLLFY